MANSEVERRRVTVLAKPKCNYLRVRFENDMFVLFDDLGNDVATSLSDEALGRWAFDHGGAITVIYNYDLGKGDANR